MGPRDILSCIEEVGRQVVWGEDAQVLAPLGLAHLRTRELDGEKLDLQTGIGVVGGNGWVQSKGIEGSGDVLPK